MFISIEGLDGSGKTTQAQRLYDWLRLRGHDVLLTREPGGTPIGEQIRALLHDLDNTAMQPATELLLYNASRAQLVAEELRPQLESGGIALCDRYADSTLAYQGYGHGQDLELCAASSTRPPAACGRTRPFSSISRRRRRWNGGAWPRYLVRSGTGLMTSRSPFTSASTMATRRWRQRSRNAGSVWMRSVQSSTCRRRCARRWPSVCHSQHASERGLPS